MTADDLERAAKVISFCGGLALWKPRIEVERDRAVVRVRVSLEVPERDTGKAVPVVKWQVFDARTIEHILFDAEKFLSRQIFDLAMHEVSEGIMYGGERPFDPHRPQPSTSVTLPAAPVSPLRF